MWAFGLVSQGGGMWPRAERAAAGRDLPLAPHEQRNDRNARLDRRIQLENTIPVTNGRIHETEVAYEIAYDHAVGVPLATAHSRAQHHAISLEEHEAVGVLDVLEEQAQILQVVTV